jgi:hypothetical protein
MELLGEHIRQCIEIGVIALDALPHVLPSVSRIIDPEPPPPVSVDHVRGRGEQLLGQSPPAFAGTDTVAPVLTFLDTFEELAF